ncbi:hypothetical protein AB0P41_32705 [Streptomyces sp. NPDC079167]|uniref:hypothetical protein n=1 Tax=Streptomyces sp. NPDC079167 TaxID=3154513 RepID=UPI0034272CAA
MPDRTRGRVAPFGSGAAGGVRASVPRAVPVREDGVRRGVQDLGGRAVTAVFAGGTVGAPGRRRCGRTRTPAWMIALALVALVAVGFGRRAAFPTGR